MKKRNIFLMLSGVMIVIIIFIAFVINASSSVMSALTVTTLKIGKADSIIIQHNSKTMLIDSGEKDDGEEICDFLTDNDISRIDVLIITHFDKDHVGGSAEIVENFAVGDVYIPDYEGSRDEYFDFLDALDAKSVSPERLTSSVSFNFGDAEVLIEPPLSYEIPEGFDEYDNNFSLITTVKYGKNSFVFAGDAEEERIKEWLENSNIKESDLLKIPHHGAYTPAIEDMIETLTPEFAIITDSKKNPADDRTLNALEKSGTETFETKDGNITAVSDGKKVTVSQ